MAYKELFQALSSDHDEIRSALKNLISEENNAECAKGIRHLQEIALPHMEAEEKTLYSRLDKNGRNHEDVLKAKADHHAFRLLIDDLSQTPANDELFRSKIKVAAEAIERHLDEEEDQIFEDVKETLGDEDTHNLTEGFLQERSRLREAHSVSAAKNWM